MNNTIKLVSGLIAMGCTVALGALVEISEYRRYRAQKRLNEAEAIIAIQEIMRDMHERKIHELEDELIVLKAMKES